jgi:hypothetical protein
VSSTTAVTSGVVFLAELLLHLPPLPLGLIGALALGGGDGLVPAGFHPDPVLARLPGRAFRPVGTAGFGGSPGLLCHGDPLGSLARSSAACACPAAAAARAA